MRGVGVGIVPAVAALVLLLVGCGGPAAPLAGGPEPDGTMRARGGPCLLDEDVSGAVPEDATRRSSDRGTTPPDRPALSPEEEVLEQEPAQVVAELLAEVPGVTGSFYLWDVGRTQVRVAAGDDPAAACDRVAAVLDPLGLPYQVSVFAGPTEDSVRGPVRFGIYVDSSAGTVLHLSPNTCNGDPVVTRHEETADEIRLEVTGTNPTQGRPQFLCQDNLQVALDGPLGDRDVVDLSTGVRYDR